MRSYLIPIIPMLANLFATQSVSSALIRILISLPSLKVPVNPSPVGFCVCVCVCVCVVCVCIYVCLSRREKKQRNELTKHKK